VTNAPTERGEHIWTRLRHRKVVQWGLVYVAGAWGFLQGGPPTKGGSSTKLPGLINRPARLATLRRWRMRQGLDAHPDGQE
jgi:hypothetical protein